MLHGVVAIGIVRFRASFSLVNEDGILVIFLLSE